MKNELVKLNKHVEDQLIQGVSGNKMFQNLQGTILQTMQKNFKDMINDIKSDLVLSNLIKEDVGISLYKAKHDPVPLLDRGPVEFFMNDN